MKPKDSLNGNDALHVFDAVPGFAQNAAITSQGGVRLFCYLTSVTPEMASKILQTQVNNRNLSLGREREYRQRMKRGEWMLAEPWLFDKDGHLIDGQHRATALAALKDYDITIPVLLVQGWPDETQSAVDIGYNRTICAIAQLQGVDLSNVHLSIMNAMLLMNGNSANKTFRSPAQAVAAYEVLKPAVDFASKLRGGTSQKFAPVRAVVALAYPYENHQKLGRFLEVWDTMIAANEVESSIARLRSQHETSSSQGGGEYRKLMAYRTVSVLQAFLEDRPLSRIREKECPWPMPDLVDGAIVFPPGYPLLKAA